MNIEPNMYVRTKEGKIFNCFASKSMGKPVYYIKDSLTNGFIDYNEAYKVSPNIIDIVQVGDYVNGEKVIKIYEKGECYDGSHYVFITKTIETENDNYETIPHDHLYTDYSINSIVTKEQFESISYKVGE